MDPEQLVEAARLAVQQAYAPYSKYRVGAALLCADGTVFQGCNIENAAYGLTNCAERTALFAAVAAGHREFRAIAVAASGEAAPQPCGACRQVLAEFCPAELPVYVEGANGIRAYTLGELLPFSFDLIGPSDDE